jgi:hypothetical protein
VEKKDLKKTNPKKNDMEVFITRGKDSIKTLRYLRTNNIKSVLSNYEDKIIRYSTAPTD